MPDEARAVGSFTFVGHATALISWGPFQILTDPSFLHAGQRAYLGWGLSTRRRREPALGVDDLPADLDAVVLSHLHGDHWDRVARRGLDRGLPIVTTPHAARRLQGWQGFRRANGLATWETYTAVKGTSTLRVTALPARHARGPVRWMLPPVMGSLVEFGDVDGPAQRRLYLTGDTVMYDGVREIARRIGGGVDLTVVHLGGAVLPGGVMVSMDAVQGVELVATILPRLAVPVHVDDYDVCRTTVDGFRAEVERRGMEGRVTYVERGETVTF